MALKIELESAQGHRCGTEIFKINGVEASVEDFGEVKTTDIGCCSCCVYFVSKFFNNFRIQSNMAKYKITEDEIKEIVEKLKDHFDCECNGCN